MKNDNAKNKKKFNIGTIAVAFLTICVIGAVLVFIIFLIICALEFSNMTLGMKITIPLEMLLVLLAMVLFSWFLSFHCTVSDDSFTYCAMNYLESNYRHSAYAKYIKPKKDTLR
ncbi:MAG: hypothetical protein K2G31_00855, partial [Clostridia bacterium]|nr:hypothetical protein [Clostridia bacterium]